MYTRALFLKKSVFLEISAFHKTNNSIENSTKPSAKAKMKSKVHMYNFRQSREREHDFHIYLLIFALIERISTTL